MKGPPSPGRQMPAKAKSGCCSSVSPNHTLVLRPTFPVHSQKVVTGTMQRRAGSVSALRQNALFRLRTLVTGRPPADLRPGKPHCI